MREKNPDMRNTEISRELGKEWRKISDEERKPYIDREKKERENYKVEIAKWREEQEKKEAEMKKKREEQQKLFAEETAKALALQAQQGAVTGTRVASASTPQQYPGYPPHGGAWPPPYMYYPPHPQQGEDSSPLYPNPRIYPSASAAPQVLGPSGMPQGRPAPFYSYPYPPTSSQGLLHYPIDPEHAQFQGEAGEGEED